MDSETAAGQPGPQEEARSALRAIVGDPAYGLGTLSDPQAMSNLLKDYLPDARRERGVLVAAAENDLIGVLREHLRQGMDPGTAIAITAAGFATTTSLTPQACTWAAQELAAASGLVETGPAPRVPAGSPTGHPSPAFRPPPDAAPAPAGPAPRRRRWLAVAGAVVAVIVVGAGALIYALGPGPGPGPGPKDTTLKQLMVPVASGCRNEPVKAPTVLASLGCTQTKLNGSFVLASQYSTQAAYLGGISKLNSATGFSRAAAVDSPDCPPPGGHRYAYNTWGDLPRFPNDRGSSQLIECFTAQNGDPAIIWTMPSLRVIWIAEGLTARGVTLPKLSAWWRGLNWP